MPARVHAVVVARSDSRLPVDVHLRRTLAAVAAQTRAVDALTIVVCGDDTGLTALAVGAMDESRGAESVIAAPRSTTYAAALRLAGHRFSSDSGADAVWLLAQDTAPEPDALARLVAVMESSPSIAIAAPKLVRWQNNATIVSLGATMTRWGRSVVLAAGEFDQGQHDAREDVLGADVRGMLVRADDWAALGGVDPALAGADEGLDLGVRARLAGKRVALATRARVAVAGDGVAGVPRGDDVGLRLHRAYVARAAQLHRRLVYAPALAVPLHWLSLLPLALWRSLAALVAKRPLRIGPEVAAAIVAMLRLGAVARARTGIRRTKRTSWPRLAPLRMTRAQWQQRLDDAGAKRAGGRDDLRFFSGGGAWVVLAFLAVSVAAFPALLAWPVLGGGALAPLRTTVSGLWAEAGFGPRFVGWFTSGPADPFSAVVALLGSLWPTEPARVLVVLWLLALPLAALGGWFAATRLTSRSGPRAFVAIAWALAPTLLAALVEGRPAGVIVHLALPWMLWAAAVAHRSWSASGVASLLVVVVVASAPSVAPALMVLWVLGLVLTLAVRRGRGIMRVAWLAIPALIFAAPLVVHRIRTGNGWALLADPGVLAPAPVGEGVWGRLAQIAGYPAADPGGWASFLPAGAPTWWVVLLTVPLALLAIAALRSERTLPVLVLWLMAAAGSVTAVLASTVAVSTLGAEPIALWSGAALSIAWAGLLGAAVLGVGALPAARAVRGTALVLSAAALAVAAVPSLTATARGDAALTNGPASTLPAFVAAELGADLTRGVLVLTPQEDGSLAASTVWGSSATIGGQSTLVAVPDALTETDQDVARLTADVVTDSAVDVAAVLAQHSIAFVVLDTPTDGSDAARAVSLSAQAALEQRDRLENVSASDERTMWRVDLDVPPRPTLESDAETARVIAASQIVAVLVALLLAVPTAASIASAARRPRVVGMPMSGAPT